MEWFPRRFMGGVLLLLTVSFLTGCGMMNHWSDVLSRVGRKKHKEKEEPKVDLLIGVVEMVNPERHFVLVRNQGVAGVSNGAILETRSKFGTKARLVAGSERKQSYISADIQSGSPQIGDLVYLPASQAGSSKPTSISVNPMIVNPNGPSVPTSFNLITPGMPALRGNPQDPMIPGVPPSAAPPSPVGNAVNDLPPVIR